MRTIQRDIVGAVIISADDKILLGNSIIGGAYQGTWIVPGGGIDEGETQLQALRREMLEETGIDIADAEVTPVDHFSTGESLKTLRDTGEQVLVQMNFNDFTVRLTQASHEVPLALDDDFTNATWFSKSELSQLTLSAPTKRLLQQLGHL